MALDSTHLRGLALSGEPFDPVLLLSKLAKQDGSRLRDLWRTRGFKKLRELKDACLFAYGLGILFGSAVTVLHGEIEDYDFVLKRAGADGVTEVMGVQLKELPPETLNSTITLQNLLTRQTAHAPTDATLLIRLNRTGYIPDDLLSAVELPFAELWYLWAAAPDGSRWCVRGDALRQPRTVEFAYPLQQAQGG
jgi:hypothetical protein